MNNKETIGFVGLGNMGPPMARCLAKAGHGVMLYDLRRAASEALAKDEDRFRIAADAAALGQACDVVITMLPDSDAVRQAVLGGEGRQVGGRPGFAGTLARGALVIDMSSSAPLATRALGAALRGLGVDLIDAPVSGGVPRAHDGSLTIMAGGDAALVDRAEPILSAMGTVVRTGPLGSGHAMKALNNFVSAAGLLAVCEALIVAERFGLDPQVMNDVLKVSTGRNNTTDNKVERYLLPRAFDSGFALELMRKDVGMAKTLAEDIGLDAPWLRACCALLDEATRGLEAGADHTAAFAYLERRLTESAKA
ncbi:MAG: NAD(P)-dependent oxidoreductase [Rhodospirillales bacterium]|nr:NAD(P)-dependent oxidoreductase [Rhodospirillales bacterium]MDH3911423.1 NAD(P)-dependent oxidoreductase [Rhodospirillales bacterium]MDH3969660.1 NAD(P)-dependent oxidoreductase [Rhodospirillales bacterium]